MLTLLVGIGTLPLGFCKRPLEFPDTVVGPGARYENRVDRDQWGLCSIPSAHPLAPGLPSDSALVDFRLNSLRPEGRFLLGLKILVVDGSFSGEVLT